MIHLVRHGQSDWNLARRLQGQRDEPVLTELGRMQASAAAATLAERRVTALRCSDLRRTVETAQIIGLSLGVPVQADVRLREQSLGRIEGLSTQEALDATAGHDWTDPSSAVLEGESLLDVAARVAPLLSEVRRGDYGDSVVLVSHGDTIRVMQALLGGDPALRGLNGASPPNGAVISIAGGRSSQTRTQK